MSEPVGDVPGTLVGDVPGTTTAERLVLIIEAVAAAAEPVGPRGLARQTAIDRSAVSRLLKQLLALGVVRQAGGGYSVGERLYTLANLVSGRDSLLSAARPVLQRLVERFNETCYVTTFEDDAIIFRDKVESQQALRLVAELGKPVYLHAGAGGRAVLAGLSRAEAAAALRRVAPLQAVTPNTIVDIDTLLDAADGDRRQGYTVSIAERTLGGAAIAAPYFDATGRCRGSVDFTCPLDRLDRAAIPAIGATVAEAALDLSRRLGYGGPFPPPERHD